MKGPNPFFNIYIPLFCFYLKPEVSVIILSLDDEVKSSECMETVSCKYMLLKYSFLL